jgi:hypothetical protein
MSRIATKAQISTGKTALAIPTVKSVQASIQLLSKSDRVKVLANVAKVVAKDLLESSDSKQLTNEEETLDRWKSAKEGNVVSMPPGPVTAQSLMEFARGV